METKVNRKKTRKLLYQELFARTFQVVDVEYFYSSFFEDVFTFNRDEEYLKSMRKLIEDYEGFFVYIIEKYSPRFSIEKMNTENIIPIYISLAEIFYLDEEIPIIVSINEAVDLAKKFGDNSSKSIVNGVLNNVLLNYDKLEKEKEKHNEKKYSIFTKGI